MVFYNSKYEDISEAKPKDDGLAVIGVMIQVYRLAITPYCKQKQNVLNKYHTIRGKKKSKIVM